MTIDNLDAVLGNETEAYSHPWTKGIFLDCLQSGYHCNVLYIQQKVVGHSVLMSVADEAHLLNITIAPCFQRQGLGHYLLNILIARAKHLNATMMFLEVRESNYAAITLYQRAGFNEVGIRKDYYPLAKGRENAVLMALPLTVDD
ncbi:ribosomal protein S18-alanine N-acetyltransferase [Zooshikella sp. WH53]|uniref:[Ribosomal protein bS18]-alanine N-acetyltransferase n=2 Tax=Zooshikella harenae TaxID=2827238 RepID=A0ABS5ZJJ3_9GAMM|nr:ribosomal protein S18-alanine N-acetyltransferase [Zooshikella harenae]